MNNAGDKTHKGQAIDPTTFKNLANGKTPLPSPGPLNKPLGKPPLQSPVMLKRAGR